MSVINPKLELREKSDSELLAYAKNKEVNLSGMPAWPLPFPQLAALMALITPFFNAIVAAEDGSRTDTESKDHLREQVEDKLIYLSWECSYRSASNLEMFLSSGFQAKDGAVSHGLLSKPQGLEAEEGMIDSSSELDWNPVEFAKSYVVQMTSTISDEASWKDVGFPTSSNFTVINLVKGRQYWFRVAAVNHAGPSDWSDPATRFTS